MIKAVLFDFDGVLSYDAYASRKVVEYISEVYNLSLDLVKRSYYKHNERLLRGEIIHKDMWGEFCKDIGKEIDISMLSKAFEKTHVDKRMVEVLRRVKKDYLTALVTDNKVDRIEKILDYFDLRELFDVVTISANVGSKKDKICIFEDALVKLGVKGNECVFIDNLDSNLTTAKKLGIHTILFDDEKRDYDAFHKELVEFLG